MKILQLIKYLVLKNYEILETKIYQVPVQILKWWKSYWE